MSTQKKTGLKSGIELTPGAQTVMSALGITPDRCHELCTHVEEVADAHPDWDMSAVLQESLQHCANANEETFMISTFMAHQGFQSGLSFAKFKEQLFGSIFEHIDLAKQYSWRGTPRKEKESSNAY